MSIKNATNDIPNSGAKGGIVVELESYSKLRWNACVGTMSARLRPLSSACGTIAWERILVVAPLLKAECLVNGKL